MNTDPMEFARIVKEVDGDKIIMTFINRIHPVDPANVIKKDGEISVAPMNILDDDSCIEIRMDHMSNGNEVSDSCLAWISVHELDSLLIKAKEIERLRISDALEFNLYFGILNTVITDIPSDSDLYYLYGKTVIEIAKSVTITTAFRLSQKLVDYGAHQKEIDALYLAITLAHMHGTWLGESIVDTYNSDPESFTNTMGKYIKAHSSTDEGYLYFACLCTALKHGIFTYSCFANKKMLTLLSKKSVRVLNISNRPKNKSSKFLVYSSDDGELTSGSYSLNMFSVLGSVDNSYCIDYEAYSDTDVLEYDLTFEITPEEWLYVLTKACKIRDCMTEISFLESYKHACSLQNKK